MDLTGTKVTALLIMLVLTLISGYLPLKLRKFITNTSKADTYLSATICFGAGVLMATVFLHLIPEVIEEVNAAMASGYIKDVHYPIGFLIVCAGFFIMYLIDELVHTWAHNHHGDHSHHHHHNDLEIPKATANELPVTNPVTSNVRAGSVAPCPPNDRKRSRCDSTPAVAVLTGCDVQTTCPATPTAPARARIHSASSERVIIDASKEADSSGYVSTLRSILVVLALSIHGCLEGLSLGLETTTDGIWIMFGALSAHKIAIGFSIGMELLEKGVKLTHYALYMVIFSIASPLGGAIGGAISGLSSTDTAGGAITIFILSGFSAGTILYVVFCEILERERSKAYGRIARYIALLAGFVVMACLLIVHTHDHDHSGHDHSNHDHADHDHTEEGHVHSANILRLGKLAFAKP